MPKGIHVSMYVYSFKVSEYESDDYVEFSASKQIVHFCALGVPGFIFLCISSCHFHGQSFHPIKRQQRIVKETSQRSMDEGTCAKVSKLSGKNFASKTVENPGMTRKKLVKPKKRGEIRRFLFLVYYISSQK